MRERFDKMIWYVIAMIAIFYFSPILCYLTNVPLYNLLPVFYLCAVRIISFMFAQRHGGDWLISVASMIAFIPCMYMFFNASAWIYVPIFGIMSFGCVILGTIFKNRFLK